MKAIFLEQYPKTVLKNKFHRFVCWKKYPAKALFSTWGMIVNFRLTYSEIMGLIKK